MTFSQYIEAKMASNPSQVFHGTTAQFGRASQAQGVLNPRGTAAGNWSAGPFGGNPSNPNLVYVCTDRRIAIGYAQEVCQKYKTADAALVILLPDWKFVVPDEDVVFNIINTQPPTASIIANKVWTAYAQYQGFANAAEAYDFWHNPPEEVDGMSDSELASHMKDVAEKLPTILTPNEMMYLTAGMGTVAFSKPLQVVNVEFFKVK